MSSIPPIFTRTTSLMSSNMFLSQLRNTQKELSDIQRQAATGDRYAAPSDSPANASAILYLKEQLASRDQYDENLRYALSLLNTIDSALGEANGILVDAQGLALSQIGVGSDAETREATALIVDAQLEGMLNLANQQFNNVSLFGGSGGGSSGEDVFVEFLGGVRYTGTTGNLNIDLPGIAAQPFTSNGQDAFGALSSRVKSQIDLDPQASADTRLSDLQGALGEGVRKGSIRINVDGTQVNLDLTGADTLGDVVTRVNDAIDNIDPAAGSIAISGSGFELTAAAGHTVTIADIGNNKTAGDLGIRLSAAAGSDAGPTVNRKLTSMTQLSDLSAAIDWASGLHITHGEQTKVADFSSAQTIQDLQNVIDDLNLGLRLEINSDATGLNLVSEVSGIQLSIGENGGSTAEDLGLRTFGSATKLADFRSGLGVETIEGEDDIAFTLHDGSTFSVNLDGVTEVAGVITAIEDAATIAGIAVGTDFTVGLASTGNGFVFEDNTAGAESFTIANLGESVTANHLGIAQSVGAATTITGSDNATVEVDSVFTHLIQLRDSLRNDDERGITLAGSAIEADLQSVSQARAVVGVQSQRVEHEQTRSSDQGLTEKTMLAELKEADLTEVLTRFTQLQQQWQAGLQTGAQNLQMSLLDFLR